MGHVPRRVGHDGCPVGSRARERQYRDPQAVVVARVTWKDNSHDGRDEALVRRRRLGIRAGFCQAERKLDKLCAELNQNAIATPDSPCDADILPSLPGSARLSSRPCSPGRASHSRVETTLPSGPSRAWGR
jgi:hypothetical protein